MFRSIWDWLFAPRVKWVVIHRNGAGKDGRARFWLYWPDAEGIRAVEKQILELELQGWEVVLRPRRPV